jgi:uncharacterized protein (TIGR02147 family)
MDRDALLPPITAAEAKGAVETLLKLGLAKRDADGKLLRSDDIVSTGDEVTQISVAQYHREMIQKGAESIDQIPAAERDISSVTLSIGTSGMAQVKELVQRFRKELLAIAQNEVETDQVVQLNFQLFPLARAAAASAGTGSATEGSAESKAPAEKAERKAG